MMLFYIMQVFVIIPLFSYSGMFLLWNLPAYRRPPDWTYFYSERKAALHPEKRDPEWRVCLHDSDAA